uniref:Uncharacterized protein n=1 Tax=Euplotes harpa TaxID=151035 RepID=A0A7S3N3S8_9SPIT
MVKKNQTGFGTGHLKDMTPLTTRSLKYPLEESNQESEILLDTGKIDMNVHLTNVHKPFINKENVLKSLQEGVTLNSQHNPIDEKPRFTFMNK